MQNGSSPALADRPNITRAMIEAGVLAYREWIPTPEESSTDETIVREILEAALALHATAS